MRLVTPKKESVVVKFNFDESGDSGVELRHLTEEFLRAAREKFLTETTSVEIRPDNRRLEKVRTPEFDADGFREYLLDNLIAGWWGIFLDDKEVECTAKNKLLLYQDHREFSAFVDAKRLELEEVAKESYGSNSAEKN